MSPLWTSLDVLSLTGSCNTFTSSHLPLPHRLSLRLSQHSPTMSMWETYSAAGSGIHKIPVEGQAEEMHCSQRFIVIHSPMLQWVFLSNILLTIHIPFPFQDTPLVWLILVYLHAPLSKVRNLGNSQDFTLGIPNIWTLRRWSVHAVTRITKA